MTPESARAFCLSETLRCTRENGDVLGSVHDKWLGLDDHKARVESLDF